MSDTSDSPAAEIVDQPMTPAAQAAPEPDVSDPAKLIRLGTMLQTMLTELKDEDTDSAGVARLAQIHQETVEELEGILSEDLREELNEFNACCDTEVPSESEMRVAQAQLVGWIQGLLRGMQATATAQAAMAQQQMMMMQAQMQQRALGGAGGPAPGAPGGPGGPPQQPPRKSGGPAVPDSGYL